LLLLNSDTVVPPKSIDMLINRLIDARAMAAGPLLVDAAGRPEISFGSALSPLGELRQRRRLKKAASTNPQDVEDTRRLVGEEQWVDWVSGACLLVRRSDALAVGLLDERYFMYEEDVDFCAALRARGGKILFTPECTVTHLRGRSIARLPEEARQMYDRSHLAYYQKHAPLWAPLLRLSLALRGRSPK
jgi:GT2 family glycosyltransferase